MLKANVQHGVTSYSAAISACEQRGQWQEALTFEAMQKAKVQQGVTSYSAAISACEQRGQWQEALTFEAMQKAKVQQDVIQCSHQCLRTARAVAGSIVTFEVQIFVKTLTGNHAFVGKNLVLYYITNYLLYSILEYCEDL